MSDPVVLTKFGQIKGIERTSCYGKSYKAFFGIPYANQPTQDRRYHDATPLETPWNGVFDATTVKLNDSCHQLNRTVNPVEPIGTDECLKLNIYTRDFNASAPVMVYIHGGGFKWGSGSPDIYGPDYLLEHDVVLVTINYRLLLFGFLSLPDAGIPGNAGLKDQLLALKWVKQNISSFGGDPGNVTLCGQSAGAVSVHYHMLSPMSAGMFNRAILMSGTAFCPWAINRKDVTLRFATALGYTGAYDQSELLKFFLATEPRRIVLAELTILTPEEKAQVDFLAFQPVIDGEFIPRHPAELARNAWSNGIDIIIGGCSSEGLLFNHLATKEFFASPKLFESLLKTSLIREDDIERKAQLLREGYYKHENPSVENVGRFIDLLTDKTFLHANYLAIRARNGTGKTWLYRFNVAPKAFMYDCLRMFYMISGRDGSCHSEDLLYTFKSEMVPEPGQGSEEYRVMKEMTNFMTNFVRTGNPGMDIWKPIDGTMRCLNIENTSTDFIEFPEMERMKLWDTLCKL